MLRRAACRAIRTQVALQHGCGDKWGLFASYIPHRVGYQCSAAYRHIIIPRVRRGAARERCALRRRRARRADAGGGTRGATQGLLRDNNFRMTASGEAIWASGRADSK
jgi:hypothetical protein